MKEYETNNRADDRTLVLRQIEGQKVKSSTGLADPRLFKGENELHCIMLPNTDLWQLRYSIGITPIPLKQKFTSFKAALTFAREYFGRRGLEIIEVID